ncbi:MAG: tripartite tricarboxylate transporter TctB family protein [Clostridiales bacterium]|nr:tripartite tricarboxylate transporter TctB family protein [Clostridiales bacterium]
MNYLFILVLGAVCLYLYAMLGMENPAAGAEAELGAAFWPRAVLVLLIIMLAVNFVLDWRRMKRVGLGIAGSFDIGEFLESRPFAGMILVACLVVGLPYVGFLPACFVFLIAGGILVGEKRPVVLFLFSLAVTVVLYVLFQGLLGVNLPGGENVFGDFSRQCAALLGLLMGGGGSV